MNKQCGISLIEVMIALVVFAIGVGGMAGLQLRSLGMSIDSTQRSVVLAKSQELADRIRSNKGSIAAYVSTFNNVGGAYCGAVPASNCADSNQGAATNCNGGEMAAYDSWDVFCRADSGMDASVINWSTVVSCANNPCVDGNLITISTNWVSRTGDKNKDLVVTAGTSGTPGIDPTSENLVLSFVP